MMNTNLASYILSLFSIFSILSVLSCYHSVHAKEIQYNIVDFGAKSGDLNFDNSPIFKKVISLCQQEQQKEYTYCNVIVPSGTFMTSPFNVTSNMKLKVEKDGIIIGSERIDDFPLVAIFPSFGKGREVPNQAQYASLVSGFSVKNVTLEGPGTIDGNGMVWWKKRLEKELNYTRARLVEFLWSEDITIRNITLINSPFWTLHPIYCKNVLIEYIHINNPAISPNTDGIDPDSSENVIIRYSKISAGDDNISIKSGWDDAGMLYGRPSKNIEIYGNTLFVGDGIAIGSEMSGGVENIHIHDNIYTATANAVRIKTGYGRGGYVRNIKWENELLDGVATCMFFNMHYSDHPGPHNETLVPKLRDISLMNFSGVCVQAGDFSCLTDTGHCELSVLKNIHIASAKSWKCENLVVNELSNVTPAMCKLN